MTDVAPALTDAELAALAGPSNPRWFMVFDDAGGTPVGTARVASDPTYPLTSLPITSPDSGWANILPGQTVFIGSAPGGFDKGIYRVRWDNFLSYPNLEIMAIGENDSGEINIALRNVGIANGDYVTVLSRFDPFGVNPRIVYPGSGLDASIFEDWDDGQFTQNRYPPPIVNIVFDDQPSKGCNFAKHVFSGTSYTFNITAHCILWPTSASVSWTWVLPSSWTLNSGALIGTGVDNTINVTAPHSPNTYEVQFHAQENNGSDFASYRKVWIKSFTYPPLDLVKIDSHVDDRTGSKWTVTLNKLIGLPPGAMIHLFDAGTWNGVDVPTAIHCFTGYVKARRETTDIGVANVSLDLVGPSYVLDLIGGQSQIMTATSDLPLTYQDLYYLLSYLDFVIWWILFKRTSGFLQTFNYTPFGLSNSQKRMTAWQIDAATLLQQLQAQAKRYGGGNFGCDPSGEFMLRVRPSNVPWGDRGGIPVRDTLDAGRYKGAELQFEARPGLRHLRGECFVSDGLTTDTPVWSDAPRIPSQGTREEKFDKQICDSADELYEGSGNEYQARNNSYPSGTIQVPKNYAALYPAQMSRLGLDIAPALRYDGQEYDGYILPIQVTYTHNADGTIDVSIGVEAETVGVPGIDAPIPQPDPSTYNSPYQAVPFAPIPPWRSNNPNPAGTKAGAVALPKDGSVGFCGTATKAYLVKNFIGTPQYKDVTPGTLGSDQIKHGMLQIGGNRAWIIADDGGLSKVWTAANAFATVISWTNGATLTGVYTLVRPSDTTPGDLLVYNPGGAAGLSFDFALSNGGWTSFARAEGPCGPMTTPYTSGQGWTQYRCNDGTNYGAYVNITYHLPSPATITDAQFTAVISGHRLTGDVANLYVVQGGIETQIGTRDLNGSGNGSFLITSSGGPWTSVTDIRIRVGITDDPAHQDVLITVPSSLWNAGSALVAASTDNGGTWASPLTVGNSPGAIGGFDLQHGGTVSYAALAGAIKKASTIGGAYSSYASFGANPILIEIPWGTKNSRSANSGANPQVIVGLDQPDSGKTLLWFVGGSPVDITPKIGGVPGIPVGANCLCTWLGLYVALIATFAGIKHLVTSVNGGGTWTDRGVVNANYLRLRRLSATPGQLYATGVALDYSSTFGASLVAKAKPSGADLVFFEAYG